MGPRSFQPHQRPVTTKVIEDNSRKWFSNTHRMPRLPYPSAKLACKGILTTRPPFYGRFLTKARQRSRQSPLQAGFVSCCQPGTVVRPARKARWSIFRISGRAITGQRFARCMLVSASPDCQLIESVQGGFAVHGCRPVAGSVARRNNVIAWRAPTELDRGASGRLVHASCFKERSVGLKHRLEKHGIKQADTTIDMSCHKFRMLLIVLRPISPKQIGGSAVPAEVGRTEASKMIPNVVKPMRSSNCRGGNWSARKLSVASNIVTRTGNGS